MEQAWEDTRLLKAASWRETGARLIDPAGSALLGMGAFSTAIATGADTSMREQWGDHQNIDRGATKIGQLIGSGLPGALMVVGQYPFDAQVADTHAQALITAGLMTQTLKLAVQRKRPSFDKHTSFPSGHTSTTFATATVMTEEYGWKAGVVAYPIAIFTGLSRISDDVHWTSDVVAGAFIGIAAGRAAMLQGTKSNVTYFPWTDEDRVGLGVDYRY